MSNPIPEDEVIRVVIGSTSPAKMKAVEDAFRNMFPGESFAFEGVKVKSGVRDQPYGEAETKDGARNRLINAEEKVKTADYYVGIEGGISINSTGMTTFAWIIIRGTHDNDDRVSLIRTGDVPIPPKVADLVYNKDMELGQANDIVFNKRNSKKSAGAIGLLTNNKISRSAFYAQAVMCALIPFANHKLFEI